METSLIVDSLRLQSDGRLLKKWPSLRFRHLARLTEPVVVSTFVDRLGRRTVLKRRILRAPRIASAPGSSSPFSTSVIAFTSLRSLESWVASETLSAAFASWRRITPQQMTVC